MKIYWIGRGALLGMITASATCSCGRNLTHVSDVPAGNRTHLTREQSGNADRFSGERHELYFVGGAILVYVDNRSNIACLQPFIGQGLGKHYAIVFFNHAFHL